MQLGYYVLGMVLGMSIMKDPDASRLKHLFLQTAENDSVATRCLPKFDHKKFSYQAQEDGSCEVTVQTKEGPKKIIVPPPVAQDNPLLRGPQGVQ